MMQYLCYQDHRATMTLKIQIFAKNANFRNWAFLLCEFLTRQGLKITSDFIIATNQTNPNRLITETLTVNFPAVKFPCKQTLFFQTFHLYPGENYNKCSKGDLSLLGVHDWPSWCLLVSVKFTPCSRLVNNFSVYHLGINLSTMVWSFLLLWRHYYVILEFSSWSAIKVGFCWSKKDQNDWNKSLGIEKRLSLRVITVWVILSLNG